MAEVRIWEWQSMLVSFEEICGYRIRAVDGDAGTLHDVLFEDKTSRIRYLVIEAGSWLFGSEVLLAPAAAGAIDPDARTLTIGLTSSQVEACPGIDSDPPRSRLEEAALPRDDDWVPYWQGTTAAALAPQWGLVGLPPAPATDDPVAREVAAAQRERADRGLLSAREIVGYAVAADDGDIGHVVDMLVDDDTWTIRHVVVDTRNWLPGRKVVIGSDHLRSVDGGGRQIVLGLSRREIEASREYEPSTVDAPA